MKKQDFIKIQKQAHKCFKEKKCMYPDHSNCNGGIIRSHTIQKSKALKIIEEPEGHVYGFVQNNELSSNQVFKVEKISINEASTFYGFCGFHDNKLFHCVDDYDFEPTIEQIFSLTYRTLVHEAYQKAAAVKTRPFINEAVDSIKNDFHRKNMKLNVESSNLGTEMGAYDSAKNVAAFYYYLQKNDFSKIRYLLIKTKNYSSVMTSGIMMPDIDYEGNIINDLPLEANWIALNIFTDSKNGLILFSWIDNEKSEKFILSLITKEDFLNKTLEVAFTNIENIYFFKSWWESLKPIKKSRVIKMANNIVHYDEYGNYTGLRLNNLKYQELEIESIYTNSTKLKEISIVKEYS